MGAFGGVGMRSGVPSLALGSSMKSVIDGKGHIVPGLSASLCCSKTAAAVTGACAAAVTGDALGADVVGEVTSTLKEKKDSQRGTI